MAWQTILASGIGATAATGNNLFSAKQAYDAARWQDKRNREYMEIQLRNQQQLDKLGQQIQLDTWQKTNYPAQIKMLKEAGLNPSLLYGHGGGGGATTGSQSGGSASMTQAPTPHLPFMDILNGITVMADVLLKEAQRKKTETEVPLIKAETASTWATVDKTSAETGLIGTQIREVEGRITLNASQEALNKASEKLKIKETEVADTIKNLNVSLTKLNDQRTLEAINNTAISQATIDWMKETGLNPNDGQLAKAITYLANETGLQEDTMIYLIGGAIGLKELARFIPQILIKNPKGLINSPTVKGFKK